MDRLTKRIEDCVYYAKGKYAPSTLVAEMETWEVKECMKRLAELEDQIEDGQLVSPETALEMIGNVDVISQRINKLGMNVLEALQKFKELKDNLAQGTLIELHNSPELKDKNGSPIRVGDRTRLILEDGEIREFDVCFKTVQRVVKCLPDFDEEFVNVSITGIVFCWNGYDLLPCIDEEGVSDIEKMEVIKNC